MVKQDETLTSSLSRNNLLLAARDWENNHSSNLELTRRHGSCRLSHPPPLVWPCAFRIHLSRRSHAGFDYVLTLFGFRYFGSSGRWKARSSDSRQLDDGSHSWRTWLHRWPERLNSPRDIHYWFSLSVLRQSDGRLTYFFCSFPPPLLPLPWLFFPSGLPCLYFLLLDSIFLVPFSSWLYCVGSYRSGFVFLTTRGDLTGGLQDASYPCRTETLKMNKVCFPISTLSFPRVDTLLPHRLP